MTDDPRQPCLRVALIIPAYNEAACIAATIAEAAALHLPGLDIVVVNDGSHDATSAVARATGKAHVVDLPFNLGIGGAVQTGFRYAVQQNMDAAVQFDGDGQHVAAEIPRLLAPLIADHADMVVGSRFCHDVAAAEPASVQAFRSTFIRRLGIRLLAGINRLLLGQRITDSTSGFRAYNRRALALLAQTYPVDFPEPEALLLLGRHGFRIAEIPVVMRERQGGRSSIVGLRPLYYMTKVMLAMLMTSVRPVSRDER